MTDAEGHAVGERIDRRAWFDRSAADVAPELIGCWLVSGDGASRVAGRIVEVEAYLGPEDRAAHSSIGQTRRNRTMFGRPGHLYVYRIYGIHLCANVVCGPGTKPEAVLLRAARIEVGASLAADRRGPGVAVPRLAAGPGNLARAFGIGIDHDGTDLLDGPIWIGRPTTEVARRTSARIGMSERAGAWMTAPLRYLATNEPSVSRR